MIALHIGSHSRYESICINGNLLPAVKSCRDLGVLMSLYSKAYIAVVRNLFSEITPPNQNQLGRSFTRRRQMISFLLSVVRTNVLHTMYCNIKTHL